MLCPKCNTPLEDGAAFCGSCGTPVTPLANNGKTTVRDKTVADHPLNNRVSPDNSSYETLQSPKTSLQATYLPPDAQTSGIGVPKQINTPPAFPQTPPRKNARRNILIVVLLVILVAAGTIATALILRNNNSVAGTSPGVTATTSGQVAFIDSPNSIPGQTNGLNIAINGLAAPPSGSQYMAWLINDQNEQIVPLGKLVANGQKFSLSYTGPTNGTQQASTNLIGLGNKIEVTLEQGQVSLPTGKILLTGVFPPKAFVHIRHLLFKFPITPQNIGLLVGLMNQTQLLNGQALILQNAANGGNHAAIQCAAQSIIDISEGSNGTNYKPLDANCAALNITQTGDGFGILGQGYLITAASHASLAANQTDSTANIRLHAGHIIIATNNIKGWVTTVDQDALKLLNNPTDTSVVQEIVTLSDHAYHGVDTNGDEQVDPVPGEAGAITAYIHGQLMAALPLTANG
ncbi:MAG TPA: zinc-ribbon domain-containing protein [Ktedonobacteraceae bacterium]|nr:zinc-ribbon domain-containing protein [Ktedonobacteraceae bacterium]